MQFKSTGSISTNTRKHTIKLGLGGRSELAGLSILEKELRDTIKNLASVSKNMRPIWVVVQSEIMAGINKIFESEGSEGLPGGGWPSLNRKYAAKKKAEVGPRKMLVYSGVMKASIQVERTTSNLLKITAKDPKAPIHHFGKSIPGGKGTMPKRPFMFITDEAQKNIIQTLSVAYDQAIRDKKVNVKGRGRRSTTNVTPYSMAPVRTPKKKIIG